LTHSGHLLAFHVTPGHSPTLVLDAGGGEDSSYWNALVPQLSRTTGSQIITYDRAGMGASDEVAGPWNPRRAASDLQAGLQELGITRDVVLVSHSQAGEVATYFARANPGLLSGAVLLDANVPQFFTNTQNQRLIALTTPQIEALKKQPSTKANRQLIATAKDFGPTHHDLPRGLLAGQRSRHLHRVGEDAFRRIAAARPTLAGRGCGIRGRRTQSNAPQRPGELTRRPQGQACSGARGSREDGRHCDHQVISAHGSSHEESPHQPSVRAVSSCPPVGGAATPVFASRRASEIVRHRKATR